MRKGKKNISIYLSGLLRHHPEKIGLDMDCHGWVSVNQLIENLNKSGKYSLSLEELEDIVKTDNKQRYRFDDEHKRIKACQGHSIPWVEPELTYSAPPEFLYHGTTTEALKKIESCGYISKMRRHAVHMQENIEPAWASASRWRSATPVVLKIDALKMYKDGFSFGISDNKVWCTERVPAEYIADRIYSI